MQSQAIQSHFPLNQPWSQQRSLYMFFGDELTRSVLSSCIIPDLPERRVSFLPLRYVVCLHSPE